MTWEQLKYVREVYQKSPPPDDAYTQLKRCYLLAKMPTQNERAVTLKQLPQLGDKKPYELYLDISQLVKSNIDFDFRAHEEFMSRMPDNLQPTLRNMLESGNSLEQVARRADALISVNKSINSVTTNHNNIDFDPIVKLSQEMSALRADVNAIKMQRTFTPNRKYNSKVYNRNTSKSLNVQPGWCYYHQRFKEAATKCKEGCNYPKA